LTESKQRKTLANYIAKCLAVIKLTNSID